MLLQFVNLIMIIVLFAGLGSLIDPNLSNRAKGVCSIFTLVGIAGYSVIYILRGGA